MTEAQKAPYKEVAKKQKEEYHKQIEVYKQKKIEPRARRNKQEQQKKIMKQEALQLLKREGEG